MFFFGREFNFMSKERKEGIIDYYLNVVKIIFHPFYYVFPDMIYVPIPASLKYYRNLKLFDEYIYEMIKEEREKMKKGEGGKNLIHNLIEAAISNPDFVDLQAVRDNVTMMFLAAHETTSSTILSLTCSMAQHPEIQEKLREEIKRLMPDPKQEINMQSTKNLHYLKNVVNENLRRNNPIGFSFARVATKDTVLGDIFLPKGSYLISSVRGNGFSEEVWDNPMEFNPDRWDKVTNEQKESFIPFLCGPRVCPGRMLSLIEQEIYLICLLRKYKVEFAPGHSLDKHAIDRFVVTPRLDIKFNFTPL